MQSPDEQTRPNTTAQNLNLLVWTQYFWPENFRINDLVVALKQQGVSVSVLTGKPNYPGGRIYPGYKPGGLLRESFQGIEVMRIPLWPRGYRSAIGLMLNYLSFVISGCVYAPRVLRGKPMDAILVYAPSPLLQTLPAIFCAWLRKVPLILWVQDVWPEALKATGFIRNRWLLKGVELIMRFIYAQSDSILIQSEGFRPGVERLVRHPEKIHFYPNAAESFEKAPIGVAPPYPLKLKIKQSFSVVFAGNLGKAQACSTILKAAEQLKDQPEIRFFLIGDGSEAPVLARMIQQLKLSNVTMPGSIPSEAMPDLLSCSSALLISLVADPALSATIPSKLQTYLLAGRPIIASVSGEAARIVKQAKAGLSCPAEDASALANAVLALYRLPPKERLEMGANGHAYATNHYNLEKLTGDLIRHIGEVKRQWQSQAGC